MHSPGVAMFAFLHAQASASEAATKLSTNVLGVQQRPAGCLVGPGERHRQRLLRPILEVANLCRGTNGDRSRCGNVPRPGREGFITTAALLEAGSTLMHKVPDLLPCSRLALQVRRPVLWVSALAQRKGILIGIRQCLTC